MKKLLIALLLFSSTAYAVSTLIPDPGVTNGAVQVMAPDSRAETDLTVYSTVVDMKGRLMWQAFSPGACTFRIMTTATKVYAHPRTLPAATWLLRGVGQKTGRFVNFTGCTNGQLEIH